MNDNDIIKALESISSESIGDCKRDCAFYDGKVHYCAGVVAKHSLDIINRQKAEIEQLKEAYSVYEETTGLKQVRTEAIKEFAERLKIEIEFSDTLTKVERHIDNLVKEMTEETV